MKKIKDIFTKFKDRVTNDPSVVNDAATQEISEQEIERRIDMAAKHTVKEYGHIIERLAKE